VINAFTIDVEEWFHVCGVPALAGPSAWDALESRVVDDTQRTLDLFYADVIFPVKDVCLHRFHN